MSVFDRAQGRGRGLVLAVSACGKGGEAAPGEVAGPIAEPAEPPHAKSKDTESKPPNLRGETGAEPGEGKPGPDDPRRQREPRR